MTRRLRGVAAAILAMMLAASPAAATAPSDVAAIEQRMASDPEHALTLAQDMYGRLPPTEAQGARGATLLWLMGEAQMRVADPRAGLRTLDRALAIARQARAPASLVANITLARGSALTDAGRISDALRTLQQAHRMFVALHDQRSQARALILVALLHASARDHAAALRYFDQIDDLYSDDPGLAMAVDSGRGNALLALGRYPEAQREFRGALTAARKLRNAPVMAQSLGDLAVAQLRAGDLAGASRSVARAMTIARDEEAAAIRPQLLGAAADVALHQGDIVRARHLITQRFAGVDLAHTMIAERHAHDTAYRTYVAAGDPAAALPHLAAVKRLDEQATAIARSTGAALASARFDYTNQELRIARLKAAGLSRTIDFQRATARTQRLILYGVAGATLLIIVLLGTGLALLGRSRNRERAANRDLAASNARLEKLSRAKTDFLATTSHEIRTPLNGILGMTQVMIADPHLDPATRERLGVVETAGQTMRALVDDILDMAKIETGRLTIETAPFDLHATIDAAARLWREPAEAKGLSFTVDVAGAPRWIVGDAARLRQIVFNLLSNAVKFTDAGEVSVVAASDGGMLRIEVTDSGIGISAAAQRIIFESFRQADASTTRRFGGTGLGLAICRNVAQAMGGDVTVASRAGQGSRFTLDLPLVPAAAPEEEIVTGGLLIVERHPIARAMLRSLFANHGPVTFSDGDRAVAEARRRHPAAILVDAGTFGRKPDALRALTAIAPVILLTEAITEQERHALFAAGITKVIEKPVSKKALVAALDELPLQKVGNAA